MNESTIAVENGKSEFPPALLEPEPKSLEDEITDEINAIGDKSTQIAEVYEKFLCEARSLARAGKTDLAFRKLKAARCVRNGGSDE